MANTRTSAKRARQAVKRQGQNQVGRSAARSALRGALDALKKQDVAAAKEAYASAIRALSKAASRGVLPKRRAARKISRLTRLAKKVMPQTLSR